MLPKHTSLATCVLHLASFKHLRELLNKIVHVSYDEMHAVSLRTAKEVLTQKH